MLNGTMTRSPNLQVLHRRSDLVDDADELVAESVSDSGVRHQPVVQVEIGSTDRGQLHLHDGVVRVLDGRHVLLLDPNPVRAPIDHGTHAPSKNSGEPGREVSVVGTGRDALTRGAYPV